LEAGETTKTREVWPLGQPSGGKKSYSSSKTKTGVICRKRFLPSDRAKGVMDHGDRKKEKAVRQLNGWGDVG